MRKIAVGDAKTESQEAGMLDAAHSHLFIALCAKCIYGDSVFFFEIQRFKAQSLIGLMRDFFL